MIRKYKILWDEIILDDKRKTVQVNGHKEVSFSRMDEISKELKNVNRIHKPVALLLYQDYKAGKLNKYQDCLIETVLQA